MQFCVWVLHTAEGGPAMSNYPTYPDQRLRNRLLRGDLHSLMTRLRKSIDLNPVQDCPGDLLPFTDGYNSALAYAADEIESLLKEGGA